MTQTARPLVAVKIGSKRHMDLIRAGFRTHHVDGAVTWLEHPRDIAVARCEQCGSAKLTTQNLSGGRESLICGACEHEQAAR